MADKTGIAWTESTWNPVTGCTKVSAGCKHCYAERDWQRLASAPHTIYAGRAFADVRVHPERFDQPLRWRRPRRIFVNSMSDLFHEAIPDAAIDAILAVMLLAPHHTFQVLTKRPERMRAYFAAPDLYDRVLACANAVRATHPRLGLDSIPIDNPASRFARHIWWGVSAEDQETADVRIPILLQVPVAHHWLSAEPLLGPLRLDQVPVVAEGPLRPHRLPSDRLPRLDWVVVGGESGPKARLCHADWITRIVKECAEAHIPIFVKQMGAVFIDEQDGVAGHNLIVDANDQGWVRRRLDHRAGADPQEWPDTLRVREYPHEAGSDDWLPGAGHTIIAGHHPS